MVIDCLFGYLIDCVVVDEVEDDGE